MADLSYKRKLQLQFGTLTASEDKIASYIDTHWDSIRSMSSSALAAAAEVSQPTVIRFSKKLGYESYKKMINDIGAEDTDEFINLDISELDSTRTTNQQIAEQYSAIINMTLAMNSPDMIDKAVDLIFHAGRIIVAGFSERNDYFAKYFSYRLETIGKDSVTATHTSMIYTKIRNCGPGDVIVLLTESGETRDIINFAKLAKENGMAVISLTRSSSNTVGQLSDVNFKLVEYGARTFLRSCMMRLSMLSLMDVVFLNLVKRDYTNFNIMYAKLNHMTKLGYEA